MADPTPGTAADPTPGTAAEPTPGTAADPTPGTAAEPSREIGDPVEGGPSRETAGPGAARIRDIVERTVVRIQGNSDPAVVLPVETTYSGKINIQP